MYDMYNIYKFIYTLWNMNMYLYVSFTDLGSQQLNSNMSRAEAVAAIQIGFFCWHLLKKSNLNEL